MSKRSRYILIVLGFAFFLIVAPLIVLYVVGVSYNFKNGNFFKTGILAVRSEPSKVEIYVNGQLKRTSAGDVRFVPQGQYQVTVKSPGYQDWNKRLSVSDGQVTWANPQNNYIYMFYSRPVAKNLAEDVLDFYGNNGGDVYLTPGRVTVESSGYLGQSRTYPLPKNVDRILTQDSGGRNFIFTDSAKGSSSAPTVLYFDSSSGKATDLGGVFLGLPQFQLSDSQIFALWQDGLYQIDPQTFNKTLLYNSVKAFYVQGSSLYYVQQNASSLSLNVSQAPFNQSQTLLNSLPGFRHGQLFVSFNKEIFLLADNKLYQDGGSMDELSDNVDQFNFDSQNSNLGFIHSGEFDYLDFYAGSLNFITRSGQPLSQPEIRSNIDYAFYSSRNQVNAIELDSRDVQNQYTIYSGQNLKKFFVDSSGQNMLVLDNGVLTSLKIR